MEGKEGKEGKEGRREREREGERGTQANMMTNGLMCMVYDCVRHWDKFLWPSK